MAKISTEELSRQLNIQVKKIDALKVNASVIDIADTAKTALKVGVGGLKDQLPNLTKQLKNGIPTDLAATLTDKLPGGLNGLNNLLAGATPALNELGKLKILEDFGPAKGGIQSLQKAAQDAIDEAQDELPQLLKKVEPVLAKIDQSIATDLPDLKIEIPEADLANMEKLFNAPSELGSELSTMFEKAIPQLQNAAAVTKEVFTDGSVEAIAEELSSIANKDFTELKGVLGKFAEADLGELDDILNKLKGGSLVDELTSNLGKLDQVLSGSIDQLTAGGLLKGLAEKVTNNIGSTITSFNLPTGALNTTAVKNDVLAGNLDAAKDKLVSAVPIPSQVESIVAKSTSGPVEIKTKADFRRVVEIAERDATTPEEIKAVESLKATGDAIDNKINKDLASLNGNVTTSTAETPSNPNPVSNADKPKQYNILTSREEISKQFQVCNRKLACLVIAGTGKYLRRTDYAAGAEEFVSKYKEQNTNAFTRSPDGPCHLFVRIDGTIETVKDINDGSGVMGVESYDNTVDIVLADYRQRNKPSNRQIKAVMEKIVPAFFANFPYGEVYPGSLEDGFVPLGAIPFWTVDIKDYFPTRKNLFNPNAEGYFPSQEELIKLGKEQAEAAARELRDGV